MPILTLLVARALNGAIGNANRLPWHLPEDLAHFKKTTMGGTIVMGRRTWESIGRVLPGRQMVVITRGQAPLPPGVERVASLAQALTDHSGEPELFIIGGARVFENALPLADRIILTEVELAPQGDVFFPALDPAEWVERSRTASTSVNGIRFSIIVYARKPSPSTGRSDLQSLPG
jgi:dihydrofolate reductase